MAENELMHYGILGQKWGVRRFQNPDGSLTALGRERYGLGKLSVVNRDTDAATANQKAVETRKKMYKRIDEVEKWDVRVLRRMANERFGLKNSKEKEEFIASEMERIASAARAARMETDDWIMARFSTYSIADFPDSTIEKGRKEYERQMKKASKKETAAQILGIAIPVAVGGIALARRAKKKAKSGG